ncbi:MAG: type IX secretion system membrane protein PorP/SprF [Bacteroidetes bacterium]|nr:MAG: type IX secretion system membrane protein PorP/SprF [Bacteroidota bacterium]
MKRKLTLLALAILVWQFPGNAQNDVHFSQYMFNEIIFNPAAIEISNTINASLVARQQWVGWENAPSSQALNASTYIQELFGGVGVNFIYDRLGYESFLTARAFYAFPVQVGVLSSVTFGLGAGIVSRTLDGTSLVYDNMIDPNALYGRENFVRPDFNFGTEYVDPNLTIGFAATHLYRSVKGSQIDYAPRHYYLYGKYLFEDVFPAVDIQPYLLFKSSWFMTQFDINVLAYYDKMLWGGFSYRLGDAVSAMAGYFITPDIKVGYAYDYAVGVSRGYNGGSHEIMISTSLEGFNKTRVTPKTPRIFN